MFANCSASGIVLALADVCKTLPLLIPMPFTNTGYRCAAVPNIFNMIICGGLAHNQCTIFPTSICSPLGSPGGIGSGTYQGLVINVRGSGKVMLRGAPQTRMIDITMHNCMNASGFGINPCQTVVLVLS